MILRKVGALLPSLLRRAISSSVVVISASERVMDSANVAKEKMIAKNASTIKTGDRGSVLT